MCVHVDAISGVLNCSHAQEYNDTMLTIYMASVTKGLSTVHDVIEKFNIAYDRSGPRRRQGI